MERMCAICGKVYDERWMVDEVNAGHGAEWWCWDCYKKGQREAASSDRFRQWKLHQLAESKKVKR